MPCRPQRPCAWPGCAHLAEGKDKYCIEHLRQRRQQMEAGRPSSNARGYNYQWQVYRRRYLREHPLCVSCLGMTPERITEATVVDHIIPHRGDMKLFWNPTNHQALCKICHDRKTATEDGAFGNYPQRSDGG